MENKNTPKDNENKKADVENKVLTEVEQLQKSLEELQKKNEELNELVKIQVASERNSLKRRDEVEKDLRKYGAKELGQLLIPELELLKKVLASLESHDNKELKNYLMGFEMVVRKMVNDLEEVGIKQIDLKVGDQFDEHYQEAIEKVANPDFKLGTIVEIINNGYMIYDRVLVHAKVKIAGMEDNDEAEKLNEGEK